MTRCLCVTAALLLCATSISARAALGPAVETSQGNPGTPAPPPASGSCTLPLGLIP